MNWRTNLVWQVVLVLFASSAVMAQNTNLLADIGGFESGEPSRWHKEMGTSGATLYWATDEVHSGTHSLKIERSFGDAARWVSDNNVRYWVNDIAAGVDIKVGAWVKTDGVNTNPATEDEKWQIKFWFYDSLGAEIGGGPFAVDVDQSVASLDWYADTNAVGSLILPEAAYEMKISAEAGTGATGGVWFDSFIFVGRDGWAGQNWNGFVDADAGWVYWIAPGGGNDGRTYFPASGVTDEQAHTGTYSLKVAADEGRESGELVWISETVPVTPGKQYVLSAWVMTSGIPKDSVFNAESQLGFTATFHRKMFEDGGGFDDVSGVDYRFTLKDSSTNWTQYQQILTVPDDATAVSVRARSWHLWYGTSYWDDFSLNAEEVVTSVERGKPELVGSELPSEYELSQNYPNPFNPSTIIEYQLPFESAVKLEIYNVVGQRVITLVDEVQQAGSWKVRWDGTDHSGARVASGLYLYRFVTPDAVLTKKMLLLK